MIKKYLQLARAHTAPLEMIPAVVAALLATGGILTVEVGIAALLGLLYHLAGYGHNSYSDWRNGYDKDDENKQHHPLNTGVLEPRQAKIFVVVSMVLAFGIGVYISLGSTDALAYLGLAVIAGVYYNEMGKETYLKFIPISFAHTSMFSVPYLAFGGTKTDSAFIYGAAFVFLWVVFQISVSGEIKDADTEEENFLKELGMRKGGMPTEHDYILTTSYVSPQVKMYSYGLRIVIMILGAFTVLQYTAELAYTLPILVLGIVSMYLNTRMLHLWAFDRESTIRDMALIEFCSLGTFLVMFTPTIGIIPTVVLMILSFAWVRLGNQFLWNTKIAPKV